VVHARDEAKFEGVSGTSFSPAQFAVCRPVSSVRDAHDDLSTGKRAIGRAPFHQNARSIRRERRDHHPLIPC
jgi:hypothetical protein